jgi:hypothetical protein
MKKTQNKTKDKIEGTEVEQEVREEKNGNKNLPEVSKKAEEKESPASEGQVIEPESFPAWPMKRVLDQEPYLGTDSTAVVEITGIYLEEEKNDPDVETVNAWVESLTRGDVDVAREIEVGIDMAKMISDHFNEYYDLSQMTLAGRLILTGKVFLTLKKLTRKAGYLWERWADTHLPFLKPRSRERAMLLASRQDCYPYIALGMERLELLCQATKDSKDKDPIGSLLKKYNILFSQDSETSPAEFKGLIDAALNSEKLRQNEISVNFDLVKQLTYFKVEIDNSLITRLRETKASGGSEQGYLELLALGGGKVLSTSDAEKRFQDFNSLSTRLVKTLAFIREDEKQLARIDTTVFLQLLEELQALKSKLIPDEESIVA